MPRICMRMAGAGLPSLLYSHAGLIILDAGGPFTGKRCGIRMLGNFRVLWQLLLWGSVTLCDFLPEHDISGPLIGELEGSERSRMLLDFPGDADKGVGTAIM